MLERLGIKSSDTLTCDLKRGVSERQTAMQSNGTYIERIKREKDILRELVNFC
jgi:hypothetical protein